jgi:large subunit ribosomal protein L25
LRNQGFSIGSIATSNGKSNSIQVITKELTHLLNEAGESSLLYLQIKGEAAERPALIEEIQFHPVSGQILHMMFKQVNLKEKIESEIPVELVGEFKVANGVLLTVKDAVEVAALPTDLPEKFTIDVSTLKAIGDSITLAQLDFDKDKVTLVLEEGQTADQVTVLMVQEVKEEVEEVPVAVEAAPTDAAATPAPVETKAE